jgi:uncharacterized protein YkwD
MPGRGALAIVVTGVLTLLATAPAQAAGACADERVAVNRLSPEAAEAAVLCAANAERTARGLAPWAADDRLRAAARDHGADMAAHRFFGHVSSDGRDVGDRVAATGLRAQAWGENLAAGQATAARVVRDWLASPGHCVNLLAPGFTAAGVGLAAGRRWTLDLARPLGVAAPPGPDPAGRCPARPVRATGGPVSGSSIGAPGRVTTGASPLTAEVTREGPTVVVTVANGAARPQRLRVTARGAGRARVELAVPARGRGVARLTLAADRGPVRVAVRRRTGARWVSLLVRRLPGLR